MSSRLAFLTRLRSALFAGCAAIAVAPGLAHADAGDGAGVPPPSDLASLPLEKLMQITVTSVSKRPEKASAAAAAVFVITRDDIRRSGMTSLPDVLRLAPGVNVAQVHNGQWAVSIRGFNDTFSSKLLVLVDGRPIYSAAYAGVLWFIQDLPLEDIDRIEVIRGPGAAVWGANAVNGVINIITLSASQTEGPGASVAAGSGRNQATLAFGGRLTDQAAYRVYVKAVHDDGLRTSLGDDANDASRQLEAGFRLDWTPADRDRITASGQFLRVRTQTPVTYPSLGPPAATTLVEHDQTWNLLVGWERTLTGGTFSTQAYVEEDRTLQYGSALKMTTVEGEARYRFALGERQDVVIGAGYRRRDWSDTPGPTASLVASPTPGTLRQVSLFMQDAVSLRPGLTFTLGAKAEHTTETGWELEPDARLAWTPRSGHTLWAAVSRAVRSPSIGERGSSLTLAAFASPVPTEVIGFGNPAQDAEVEISYEAGYRALLTPRFSLDAAVFDSRYRRLFSETPGAPFFVFAPAPPHVVVPLIADNSAAGHAYGLELSATWQATANWRLIGGYSALSMHVEPTAPGGIIGGTNDPGKSPRMQAQLRSLLDLPHGFEFDAAAYHVSRLTTGQIPAYTRLDMRLGWRLSERLELALVGQNLLDARHPEIAPSFFRAQEEVPRTVFVQARAGF